MHADDVIDYSLWKITEKIKRSIITILLLEKIFIPIN